MKRLILLPFLLFGSLASAQTTATTVKQQIATNLPDNNAQRITPTIMRNTLNSIVDLNASKIDSVRAISLLNLKANISDLATKQNLLTGTGFVKSTAGVISYDDSNYLTGITSANVTNALGFMPYSATNPDNYITSSALAPYITSQTVQTALDTKLPISNISGTSNYLSKFTGDNTLGNSQIYDNGTNVGIGTNNPTYPFSVNGNSGFTGTLNIAPKDVLSASNTGYGLTIQNTASKTYPTTSNFYAYPNLYANIELGTSQTYTPTNGFNYVHGDARMYTKSAGNTSDIESLYFFGFDQRFNWTDLNTCKQYIGINDIFTYAGIDANSRTSSSFVADNVILTPPANGTQTVANLNSRTIGLRGNSATNINVTNSKNYSASLNLSNAFSGSKNYNITSHSFYETSWGIVGTAGSLTTNITNLYGLKLTAPTSSTGMTITNNFGIYQAWANAKNYFAGYVGVGTQTPTQLLDVAGTTQANSFKLSAIQTAPATATSTGAAGEIRFTTTGIYICTATNTWIKCTGANF